MQLEAFEEFLVLAKELNFGRAAATSYVSRTAFSRHIHDLESYFGVPLIERARPARLTQPGQLLAAYLQEARPGFDNLKAIMRELDRVQPTTISTLQLTIRHKLEED